MINLMKADLYRIFRCSGIYFAFAIVIIISSLSVAMKEPGYIGNGSLSLEHEGETVVMVSASTEDTDAEKLLVRSVIANNINLYYPLIIVVFMILMSDFSNKTLKNTLTSVVSKGKYFAYKLTMCLGFSMLFIIFGNLFIYFQNLIVNGERYTESISNIFKATFLQMPILLGIVSFLVFIGFFSKRAALYNGISISIISVFQLSLGAIYFITKSKLLGKFLEKYEWQAILGKLAYFPESKYCVICLIIGLAEIIIFGGLSYLIFKRSEIK